MATLVRSQFGFVWRTLRRFGVAEGDADDAAQQVFLVLARKLIQLVRLIATARIGFPRARVRLSAGRDRMSLELQVLAFMAGANSIFFGDKLLTAPNPAAESDAALFRAMGLPEPCVSVS